MLETDGRLPIEELNHDMKSPGSSRCRVRTTACVVIRKSCLYVGCEPDVELLRLRIVFQDVDKPLALSHGLSLGKEDAWTEPYALGPDCWCDCGPVQFSLTMGQGHVACSARLRRPAAAARRPSRNATRPV